MRLMPPVAALVSLFAVAICASAQDGPSVVKRFPPEGIAIPAADREQLASSLSALAGRVEKLAAGPQSVELEHLLPDVEVYLKAVKHALDYQEFYSEHDIAVAKRLLQTADTRLGQLEHGNSDWTNQTKTLVRGYRSQIDGSSQPFGLVIPENLDRGKPVPLYIWLHGRGEKLGELQFIDERETNGGTFVADGAIMLHPYGRYCNAFKFAGEIDVLEAVDAVTRDYQIDRDRIVLAGFSMGGGGAWHLGAHYADRWVAVHPGAGFSESPQFLRLKPADYPPWYEQTLWGLYNVPDYVGNLFNIPVVAYSGEKDAQMQAATVMEEAYARYGRKLQHIIGPGAGHFYEANALAKVKEILAQEVVKGRNHYPSVVTLQTNTLRYNNMYWVEALGLEEHWKNATIEARMLPNHKMSISTKNVTWLQIKNPTLEWADFPKGLRIGIDREEVVVPNDRKQQVTSIALDRFGGAWHISPEVPPGPTLRKVHGLQGPIDDAFLEPFLVVLPSGEERDPAVAAWMKYEIKYFQERWQRFFVGSLRMKKDVDVTPKDIEDYNLVLWGTRSSNRLLPQILDKLPIFYLTDDIRVGPDKYAADHHVLAAIYPNPLHKRAAHYVVINSGPTFRDIHDVNNAMQTPKLPDWAVLDVSGGSGPASAGKVVDAGFFDETWQLKEKPKAGK